MASRVLRWGLLFRWAVAIGVVTALPACDTPQQEHDLSLRSGDLDDADDGPQPAAIDGIEGAPVSACPDCGSHWTRVNGEVVVHLAKELGDGILHLSTEGKFFYEGGYGFVNPQEAVSVGDGYSILVRPRSVYEGLAPEPDYIFPERAVLRLHHEKTPVDVRLRFVNNRTWRHDDPSSIE